MIWKLLDTYAGTTPSPGIEPKRWLGNGSNTGVWGASITGATTVSLEGAFDPLGPWFTIDTLSASGVKAVSLMPHMRANPTANAGTATAWLAE